MSKPVAVLISDIHFTVKDLEVATNCLMAAIDAAKHHGAPLYILGDLNDTKAIIRGECAKAMIRCFSYAQDSNVVTHTLVGNHDLLNERSVAHSLEFLKPWTDVISHPVETDIAYCIPYQSDANSFKQALAQAPAYKFVFMHQGVNGAQMGEYVQDKSAIGLEDLKNHRCFSGHYHKHQTLGTLTYIGSPYSTTFAEANDGPKGFLILRDDGYFTQYHTNQRRHVIIERSYHQAFDPIYGLNPEDLIWFKLKGPYTELKKLERAEIGNKLFGHHNFKFDKIITDSAQTKITYSPTSTGVGTFDKLIDSSDESDTNKVYLKRLWRSLYET